jgi:prevent-host-death family protein
MTTFTIHQAKTNLSRLIARAEAGEEIVIARGKEPVVRLMPVAGGKRRPTFGILKGKLNIPDSFFFDPLPEDELKLWEGDDENSP